MRALKGRRAEVLLLRRSGLTEREVAAALGISPRTVKSYANSLNAAGYSTKRGRDGTDATDVP